jgi:hypothetical protein
MAVKLITDVRKFIGLSTDTKPYLTGIGGKFTEIDTGAKFLWNGEQWVDDLTLTYAFLEALKIHGR